MDDLHQTQSELTGSLITMEFDSSGRINQLWTSDPTLPEEGEEFQFILPPITFGEESADMYYPGTILIGARIGEDSPWVLSRNSHNIIDDNYGLDDNFDMFSPDAVTFNYQFPLLPEITATGKFYEIAKPLPQILWDVTLENNSNEVIEIGELGFPLALNNYYDGFGWSDEDLSRLWHKRLYLHKYIGGSASWLAAQRMNAEPPSLLIYPGDNTSWEFYSTVPSSLNTSYQWEGIPTVYIHSKATIEREEWPNWANTHTSTILAPNESRTYQMRFIPTEQSKQDGINQVLKMCKRPAVKVYPSCVMPTDAGIGIEVSGVKAEKFHSQAGAKIEFDIDDDTSFCYAKSSVPGPQTISFEDKKGNTGFVHIFFTHPIKKLIKQRAEFICNSICNDASSNIYGAFFMRPESSEILSMLDAQPSNNEPPTLMGASGVECTIADALYVAEKNTIYPVKKQIKAVDNFIGKFLLKRIQNPLTMEVGNIFEADAEIAQSYGKPIVYPHVFNLYYSMYNIANTVGSTQHDKLWYLEKCAKTILAMFKNGWRNYVLSVGLLGYGNIYKILKTLEQEHASSEKIADILPEIKYWIDKKSKEIIRQKYPYAGESVLDTSGFEDVLLAAKYHEMHDHMDRTIDCAFAAKSIAPSWWWYGSDKRNWDGTENDIKMALLDRGEMCLAHTTIPNSFIFLEFMDRDYFAIPDAHMRLAFGGLMAPWALIQDNGNASLCYCPDYASKHRGFNPYSGLSSLGYYHYISNITSIVLPNNTIDTFSLGCHFDNSGKNYTIVPWDGVGRRIIVRQHGIDIHLSFGNIVKCEIAKDKTFAEIQLDNPWSEEVPATLSIKGMWGEYFQSNIGKVSVEKDTVFIEFTLSKNMIISLNAT